MRGLDLGTLLNVAPDVRKLISERIRSKRLEVSSKKIHTADNIASTAVVDAILAQDLEVNRAMVDGGSEITLLVSST